MNTNLIIVDDHTFYFSCLTVCFQMMTYFLFQPGPVGAEPGVATTLAMIRRPTLPIPAQPCHPKPPEINMYPKQKRTRLDRNRLQCKKRTSVDLKQMWGWKKWCCPNKVDSRLKKCKQKFLPQANAGERPDSERNRKFHINRIQSSATLVN